MEEVQFSLEHVDYVQDNFDRQKTKQEHLRWIFSVFLFGFLSRMYRI